MRPSDQGERTKRERAQGWFLTYPRSGEITPEYLLTELMKTGAIKEHVIAREEHKDGGFHLHAYIRYETKVEWKKDKWDVETSEGLLHGNYQKAKSWKAVKAYVEKGGHYISSFDCSSAKAKKGKNNLILATMDPVDAVKSGEIGFMDLQKLVKNQAIWRDLTMERTTSETEELPKDRHCWIYGPSNSGKTTRLKEMIKTLGENKFFQIPRNNDWQGYIKQSYLWMDEYKGQLTVQDLNAICDGGLKVNTKGGSSQIRTNPYVIIISNYSISECYANAIARDPNVETMLKNRFREEYLSNIY